MLKFILVLTIYNSATDATYVIDHNLTGSDCIAAFEQFEQIERDIPGARLSCERDNAETTR